MIIVGVTGTKGKSTVVNILSFVLKKLDIKYASYSTLEASNNSGTRLNMQKMTMPGRWTLPMYFKNAYKNGARIGIVEVTSSGLTQFRGDAFNFDIVAITNLQKEHIEIHGGFENYKKAKGRLFNLLTKYHHKFIDNKKIEKISIVNLDDDNSSYYIDFKADKKYVISLKENKNNTKINILNLNLIKPDNLLVDASGIHFDFENVHFDINLYGTFSVYNIMTALTILKALKIDMLKVSEILKEYRGTKGRMEFVRTKANKNVVVDYAHTPDSLKAVLTTLKEMGFKKVISIIGACGGSRDKWKRPEMGRIASELSDYVIVTNEDPYDEDPHKIINAVYMGITDKEKARIVPDRIEAIQKAIDMLSSDEEVLIVTGKGSEKIIMVKGGVRGSTKKDYKGDYEVAKEYLEKA
jgi:UDP-N-acetylmuramoyl-L-alanyl-D-glutamate--2,6-diaminopimelate ligase